jgi:ribosomal protein L37AE/L43A
MKIKKILSQSRRDFTAIYECEHCNEEVKGSGYDDSFFHQQVIPNMICGSCGEKSPEDYRGLSPKYSSSEVV